MSKCEKVCVHYCIPNSAYCCNYMYMCDILQWWHHDMWTFSALRSFVRGTTGTQLIPFAKTSNAELGYYFLLPCRSCRANNRVVGELRRHDAYVTSWLWGMTILHSYIITASMTAFCRKDIFLKAPVPRRTQSSGIIKHNKDIWVFIKMQRKNNWTIEVSFTIPKLFQRFKLIHFQHIKV